MSVTTERKIASAGMAAAMLGSLAALLFSVASYSDWAHATTATPIQSRLENEDE